MSSLHGQVIARTLGTGSLPVLALCVLLGTGAAPLAGQATPPGTVIRNWASVTYETTTGASFAGVSDTAAVTVGSASGIAVTLLKSADRASGTLGEVVTYTITYQALGSATATSLVIADALPAGAVYVPASLTLGGVPLTDATGDDPASVRCSRRTPRNAGSCRIRYASSPPC
jgi:uncharacterized repeat protein (TIGR01451 family)